MTERMTNERLAEMRQRYEEGDADWEWIPYLLAAIRREREECERLREVLGKLSKTKCCSEKDNAGERHFFCLHCEGMAIYMADIQHDEDCPTRIAADALKGEA